MYYYRVNIPDSEHAGNMHTTTKDKMIELFTLQSHPKDLLNLAAHSLNTAFPPSTLEQ